MCIRDSPPRPGSHKRIRRARIVFIGARLVGKAHQLVSVKHRRNNLSDERKRQLKAAVLFQAGKIQAGHGHLRKARFHQRLTQKVDVVGRPAPASRLRDKQGRVIQIVFSRCV